MFHCRPPAPGRTISSLVLYEGDRLGRSSQLEHGRNTDQPEPAKEEKFLAMHIPLPPLSEQRRIVARMEALAVKIDEARNLRHQAESACDALCRSIIFHPTDDDYRLVPMREIIKLKGPDETVDRNETYRFAGVYCFGGGVFEGQRKSGLEFSYASLRD